MAIKIEKKIVGYKVATKEQQQEAQAEANQIEHQQEDEANVVRMHERLERPEMLRGTTYKIKPPVSDHAMYITINDIVLNQGTEYEKYRPYEIFINSKNLDHYQWIVALTRVLSSVFRKGGDVAFLVEELKAVFDPKGGYFAGEGRFMPSIIAELGYVIERHFKSIGIISPEVLDEHQKELIEKKRQEFENQDKQTDAFVNQEFPHGSTLCGQCNTVAVVLMDNCETCLNCGYSKCG
ncbi:MAG: NrdJb [Gammaproteobacteria bacterium]|jgi:hypothetical protein|nr:NrdJb [Gammaproteobacteria bacterium]MCH2473176.1 NrdJb [Gammaproteobacteria bacterium]GIS86420.1 MAG: TSCPD domain-containing protein [Woeseia sp.]|tara:strand:- start:137 stop:847 length:711 start_codon:yes stop_codon:yes gene_type:complete